MNRKPRLVRGLATGAVCVAGAWLLLCAPAGASQAGLGGAGAGGPAGQSPLVFDDLAEYAIERLAINGRVGEPVRTSVRLGEAAYVLELAPYSVRSADFRVLVQQPDGSMREMVPPPATTYRGHVAGLAGSQVTGSLLDGSLTAVVSLGPDGQDTWIVQPLNERVPGAAADLHVIYRHEDDLSAVGGVCGTADLPAAVLAPAAEPAGPGVDETLLLELAVDTDFEFYQLRGSEASVISAVESQVNSVSAIYERDVDTAIEITTIIVRPTSSDPYTTSDGGQLLQQMTNHWRTQQTGVRRDTASLISGRNFAGGTLGVAWLPGTCTTTQGYNVNQYVSLGTGSRIAVHAHELGHNNNAPHCDGSDCRIMCPGIGGCAGDITRFGTDSRNRIRSYLDAVPCVEPLVTEPDPQPLPFADDFDASRDLDPQKWAEAADVVVTPSVVNPITPPYAVSMLPDATMTTTRFDVPSSQAIYAKVWSQHRFVEAGKFLRVEYYSTFNQQWEPLGAIQSDGSNQQQFVLNEWRLPLLATGDQFRLRISAVGSDSADAWFIDSVAIDGFCRVDINQDGEINIFDFLAFQTAFDSGSPIADFNNDTQLNVFDFLEFQNRFTTGCN